MKTKKFKYIRRKISRDNHLTTDEAGYELKERLTISVITGNIPVSPYDY